MIHSLAGGLVKGPKYYDFAKVEIKDEGAFWYENPFPFLEVGSLVTVPFGKNDTLVQGVIVRIDKSVSSYSAPIPIKHAKKIVGFVLNEK